jgi:hypothetical protein
MVELPSWANEPANWATTTANTMSEEAFIANGKDQV